jgi:outer membrane biosynthesis protein TonB
MMLGNTGFIKMIKYACTALFLLCVVCEGALAQTNQDRVRIFSSSEEFDVSELSVAECPRRSDCYVAVVKIDPSYGINYMSSFIDRLPAELRDELQIEDHNELFSFTVPEKGAEIEVWNKETGAVVYDNHRFTPDESADIKYFTVEIEKGVETVDIKNVERPQRRRTLIGGGLLNRNQRENTVENRRNSSQGRSEERDSNAEQTVSLIEESTTPEADSAPSPSPEEERSSSPDTEAENLLVEIDGRVENIIFPEGVSGGLFASVDREPEPRRSADEIKTDIQRLGLNGEREESGEVTLLLTITPEGVVTNIEKSSGVNDDMDEKIIGYLNELTFTPATYNGSTIEVEYQMIINLTFND